MSSALTASKFCVGKKLIIFLVPKLKKMKKLVFELPRVVGRVVTSFFRVGTHGSCFMVTVMVECWPLEPPDLGSILGVDFFNVFTHIG